METDYPSSEWNIYNIYLGDGDNWSSDDTMSCIEILKNFLLPWSNMVAYGQITSPYGSGQFIKDLESNLPNEPNLALAKIDDHDDIMDCIKEFLGKGH